MNTLASTLGAVALSSLVAITGALPAQAQSPSVSFQQKGQVIQTYCQQNPWDDDCESFYRGGWRDRDYRNFYSSRQSALDGIAAGIFGFTFGAAIGSIIANGNNSGYSNNNSSAVYNAGDWDSHVEACYDRYRSYDEGSDTYLGFDGMRHRCRL